MVTKENPIEERRAKLAFQVGALERIFGVKRTPKELKAEVEKYIPDET